MTADLDASQPSPDEEMAATVQAAAEWYDYAEALTNDNRIVVRDAKYFDALVTECLSCTLVWTQPQTVFRARLMPPKNDDADVPFRLSEMGAPPAEDTHGGRLNPMGIPYLYAALDIETAIAEVRPWAGARVTVATFETIGRIHVVDLASLREREGTAKRAAFAGYMMQRPTHRDDRTAYVATQFLAESLKARGVDAVLYGSRLKLGGANVAFFRNELTRPIAAQLRRVANVTYMHVALTPMKGDGADRDASS
jgi:RES domain-containing protein